MTKFVVHIRRHCGWFTTEAEGATFGEAAVAAAVAVNKKYGLDLDSIPHTAEFRSDADGYRSVVFREASRRRIFNGFTAPGALWFADQVREGKAGDCLCCAGTGVNFYNPFMQCWACGDNRQKGLGTGKHPAPVGAIA